MSIKLKDRRTGVRVTRTVKLSNDFGDFYKFELFDDGILPDEIADSEQARAARDAMFKELHEEAIAREVAVKLARKDDAVDKIVKIMQAVFASMNAQEEQKPDPPVQYFKPMDFVAKESEDE